MTDEQLMGMAEKKKGAFTRRKRTIEDFRYDEQQEKYWDTTTGNLLGGRSVDGAIPEWPENSEGKPVKPSVVINNVDTGLTVEGSTWWPGKPRFIENVVVSERGAMPLKGALCYNAYIGPEHDLTGAGKADKWIQHVKLLYPDPVEHGHFFDFCAHMIQRPDEKVNHGVVLSGGQGIGKDTALLPVRRGVGEWNAAEVGPDAITSQYNGFVKSVLLVINEVRPHDEAHKASNFYNLLKPLLASPPEMLPMTIKYANTIYIRNLCHVVLTTNDPLTMFIPAEDRRLFVMDSIVKKSELPLDYFDKLYAWLESGGIESVISWLKVRRYSGNLPRGVPPLTRGKKAIIDSADQVRRSEVDDIFEDFCSETHGGKRPICFFHKDLLDYVRDNSFDDAARQIRTLNAKNFHFKMADRGYDMVRNPDASEWRRGNFRSRIGLVDRRIPKDEQVSLLREELEKRGRK